MPSPSESAGTKAEAGASRRPTWQRGGFMLLFLIAFGIAQSLLFLIAVVQFITMLINWRPNGYLADFGLTLAMWLAEASAFLACSTDRKPFPFAPWPGVE